MSAQDVEALLTRTIDITNRLGLPVDDKVEQINSFLTGPVILAVTGDRSIGKAELAVGLQNALPNLLIRTDLSDDDILCSLIDLILVTTPCDAALSAKELDIVRNANLQKRPLAVVVTDAEKLGSERLLGEKEIEHFRLLPLLGPENIGWAFRGKGEAFDTEISLVKLLINPGPRRLHDKPVADLLSKTLEIVESTFIERCIIRDREFNHFRQAEAQGPLDLAQLTECEKVERIRLTDRINQAFERVLVAAEGAGNALSSWARSGATGDGSDGTSTIVEAWDRFTKEIQIIPNEAFNRMNEERERLHMRALASAKEVAVKVPPHNFQARSNIFVNELAEAANRLSSTSIKDLLDTAIKMAREDVDQPEEPPSNSNTVQALPKRLKNAIPAPLTLAQRIQSHLIQGIRSRIDIRLRSFVENFEIALKDQTTLRLEEWRTARVEIINSIRTALAARYSWSTVLGELHILKEDLQDFKRSHT